ncbi:MAG: MerR family transcriptional regulator [Deltaproteobacteria bacterium]|nr:MerR family transcriptional regulator [Deltaproteobacteria bacterium]MBW2020271.1 MerR family transcriptional regulator [Deltaproteobacteria bacterium]MBW2073117.1 MerR family transcriptional regulator [Deltaproteobacteria bacterium]
MDIRDQLSSIQEVSDRLKVPKHTLRFWEKEFEGILVPLRTQGGQRRYTAENIFIVEEIKKLRKRGMSLAEIRRKLSNSNKVKEDPSNSSTIDLLAERVAEVVKAEVYRFFEGE